MPASEFPRLRIAVIGISGDDWMSKLAGRDVEVVAINDLRELQATGAHLGVVLATPDDVAELLPQITDKTMPIAMFVERRGGAADRRHQASLLNVLISGKREWERTFDAILDPILVIDGGGRVLRANKQMARTLGRPIEELHGESYSQVIGSAVEIGRAHV